MAYEDQDCRVKWPNAFKYPVKAVNVPAQLPKVRTFPYNEPEVTLQRRNARITTLCNQYKVSLLVTQDAGPAEATEGIDLPWKREKYAGIDGEGEDKQMALVRAQTAHKMKEKLDKVEDKFDYYNLEALVKIKLNKGEKTWLLDQIGKENHDLLDWKRSPTHLAGLITQFEKHYGPINPASASASQILQSYRKYCDEAAAKSNWKLGIFWAYKEKHGQKDCEHAIHRHYELENANVLIHSTFKTTTDYKTSIYDPNPITNPIHAEWFMIPRFRKKLGPSNVFIRHTVLESKYVDFKVPEKVIIIDGLWTSLLDLSFSHPIRWCQDPSAPKKTETEKEEQDGKIASVDPNACNDSKWIKGLFKVAGTSDPDTCYQEQDFIYKHAQLAQYILKFPLGVEMSRFVKYFKFEHNYREQDGHLFPGLTDTDGIKRMTDVIQTYHVASRNSDILFPVAMGSALPTGEEDIKLAFKRVWYKLLFCIRYNGETLLAQEVQFHMWKHFKINTEKTLYEWGFNGYADFVDWSMAQWNPNGSNDGLIVKPRQGLTKLNDQAPYLVYVRGT